LQPRVADYLTTTQNLRLTPKVRAILVDWLVEVAQEFEFHDDTLYHAVALVDQCLAKFRVRSVRLLWLRWRWWVVVAAVGLAGRTALWLLLLSSSSSSSSSLLLLLLLVRCFFLCVCVCH
jgi:hypothetical protein